MRNHLKAALLAAAAGVCMSALGAAQANAASSVTFTGPAQPKSVVHFDVMLPLRNQDKLAALLKAQQAPGAAQYHKWLTAAQFGAQFGPDRATLHRIATELQARGFVVEKEMTRSLRVTGTADQVTRTFGAHLKTAKSDDGAMHILTDEALVPPADIAASGAKVFSFAPHVAHVHSHIVGGPYAADAIKAGTQNRYGDTGSYWFDDLKEAYHYPSALAQVSIGGTPTPLNGAGATIAAIMSSDVWDSDIKAIFDNEKWSKITGTPDPQLAARYYVNGGAKWPNDATAEASLDTQQELAGAPGAKVVLVDIPDLSDGSILAGYVDVEEYGVAQVVSASFGQCERDYFPDLNGGQDYRDVLVAYHELFEQGNAQGITFLASSGDEAGLICPTKSYLEGNVSHYVAGVSTPASDPDVTAVGGTNLVTTYVEGTLDSVYAGENAWSDPMAADDPYGTGGLLKRKTWGAGGGYSDMWPAPDYQDFVNTGSKTQRAVPDIGMQVGGCPEGATDYHAKQNECYSKDPVDGDGNSQRSAVVVAYGVKHGGGLYSFIGTSVSSPEFAGVLAHMIELNLAANPTAYPGLGNLNPYIYKRAMKQEAGGLQSYHTNIPGYNGLVLTNLNPAYSLSTGVGTPIVTSFIGQPKVAAAGTPQTPSNP
jgi:subtilase family serine protease